MTQGPMRLGIDYLRVFCLYNAFISSTYLPKRTNGNGSFITCISVTAVEWNSLFTSLLSELWRFRSIRYLSYVLGAPLTSSGEIN